MADINILLFGRGKIFKDGKEVEIPAGKLTGIIYYLAVKKSTTRTELFSVFWPDSNEQQGRNSLRNALHKIRGFLGDDFILSPNRTILELNPKVTVDVDIFKEDPKGNIDMYKEFLYRFFIDGLEELEFFILENKNYYENIYISALEEQLDTPGEFLEEKARRLIALDEYNSEGYKYLMEHFYNEERYDKVINTFYEYKAIIEKELGIPISKDIIDIKNRAIKKIEKAKDPEDVIPYAREYELDLIDSQIDLFIKNKKYYSVLLSGEYGTGKTTIINYLKKYLPSHIETLEIKCLPIDGDLLHSIGFKFQDILKDEILFEHEGSSDLRLEVDSLFDDEEELWSVGQITEKKENYDNSRVFNIINRTLGHISKDKKYVIIIEDIQWLDRGSIYLLSNLLTQNHPNIFYLLTLGDEPKGISRASLSPLIDHKIIEVQLFNYNKEQIGYVLADLFKGDVTDTFIEDIYDKTRGNPFYVYEYIRMYNNDLTELSLLKSTEAILREKLQIMTPSQWKIVNILSVYHSEMDLDYLIDIIGEDPFSIITDINVLIGLNIIRETIKDNRSYINFYYNAYRTYVYENLNSSHKQVLHRSIAESLDSIYTHMDIDMDIRLKDHYKKGGDKLSALKHEINILSYHLYFSHEVFPDLSGYSGFRDEKLYSSNEKSKQWLREVEEKLLDLKDRDLHDEDLLKEIELKYLVIKGRFLIRIGDYDNGKQALKQVINISKSTRNTKYELLGIKQIIVSNIQQNDTNNMVQYINRGIKLAKSIGDYEELGILYRLYGLYYMMEGKMDRADEFFDQALDVFLNPTGLNQINNISIAAIYNYKAEIYNSRLEFDKALESLNKAINLCTNIDANCVSLFYINGGVTSFLMGDVEGMKGYFTTAMEVVHRFDSYWKISMLYGFLALGEYLSENYDKAYDYIEKADVSSETINDPKDLGMIYFVKTYMKKGIEDGEGARDSKLGEYLTLPSTEYYINARKYLFYERDYGLINYMENNLK